MDVLVTCGPSYEPVDEVRRLTNFSTGELGTILAERLAAAGLAVVCLKGVMATWRDPGAPVVVEPFSTNDDLAERLQRRKGEGFRAVLHAAALCDYRVSRVDDAAGQRVAGAKLPSRAGGLVLRLEPAAKVIASLRGWFPGAWIAGWKYELEGDAAQALGRGWDQMRAYGTDACVVNGRAAGDGFQVCEEPGRVTHCASKALLAEWLAARVRGL